MAYQLEKGTVLDVISLRVNNIEDEITFFKKVLHLDVLLEENGIVYLGFKTANKTLISLYEDIEGIENNHGCHVLRHYKLSIKDQETFKQLIQLVQAIGYEMKLSKDDRGRVYEIELMDPENNLIRIGLPEEELQTDKVKVFPGTVMPKQTYKLQLQTVKVNVADLEESLSFYRDILGFMIYEEVTDKIYRLSSGGTSHQLVLFAEEGVTKGDFDDQFYGLDYIAFKLPNFKALDYLQQHLSTEGFSFYYNKGKEILQVDDPNGIHLWFYVTSW